MRATSRLVGWEPGHGINAYRLSEIPRSGENWGINYQGCPYILNHLGLSMQVERLLKGIYIPNPENTSLQFLPIICRRCTGTFDGFAIFLIYTLIASKSKFAISIFPLAVSRVHLESRVERFRGQVNNSPELGLFLFTNFGDLEIHDSCLIGQKC